MNMNTADAQVIAMVNAPHERRAREAARKQKKQQAQKKRVAEVNRFLWLVIRWELYILAGGLMVLALGYGWIEGGLGIAGLLCCVVGGFMELWRYVRRR